MNAFDVVSFIVMLLGFAISYSSICRKVVTKEDIKDLMDKVEDISDRIVDLEKKVAILEYRQDHE